MGRKCSVPNCKTGCKSQVKIAKINFQKFGEEWENKIHRVGKWSLKTEFFLCSKRFEYRYLEILSLKCCRPGMHI